MRPSEGCGKVGDERVVVGSRGVVEGSKLVLGGLSWRWDECASVENNTRIVDCVTLVVVILG